jgi:hypothetical protein
MPFWLTLDGHGIALRLQALRADILHHPGAACACQRRRKRQHASFKG